MNNYQKTQIANKINELSQFSISFLEDRYKKLTTGGKIQTYLLTAAAVIDILNRKGTINMESGMIELLKEVRGRVNSLISTYKKQEVQNTKTLFNIESIDIQLIEENKKLLDFKDVELLTVSSVTFYYEELLKFAESFNKYNAGAGKVRVPETIFYSIFISPLFPLFDKKNQKTHFYWTMTNLEEELGSPDIEQLFIHDIIYDKGFISTLGDLIRELVNLMNADSKFIAMLKELESDAYRPNQDDRNKSCYIATLVYEDIDHPKVELLRQYRDTTLSKTSLGRSFINYYYNNAPKWVKILENKQIVNNSIRKCLDMFIKFVVR